MTINVWLGLRDDAHTLIVARLRWDEEVQGAYTGPVTERQFKLFELIGHLNKFEIFRTDRDGARDWRLWSIDFDFKTNALQRIRAEIDQLLLDYPNHVRISGAWRWDTGARIVAYPLHARLLEFMPDVVTYDAGGNEIGRARPIVVSDQNLGQGQTERQF